MKIYTAAAHKPLKEMLNEIENHHHRSSWRCLTTKLNMDLYLDPYAQRIALNYIESNHKAFDVFDFSFYWLRTGHIYLIFQGKMQKANEEFDKFLSFVCEGEESIKPEYHLYEMGSQMGWVEDSLEEAEEQIKIEEEEARKFKEEQKKKFDVFAGIYPEKEKYKHQYKNSERAMRIKPLLLLVEDERMTRSFVEALLQPYCEIVMAETLDAGRRLYDKIWPNLVFMDIELPDGDGQTLTKEIYKKDPNAHIIMVSANISVQKLQECHDIGVKGFIAKPVTSDKDRLLSMVHQYRQGMLR